MQLSDQIRTAHAKLSTASLEFVETASRDPRYRQSSSFAGLEDRKALRGYTLQRWPTLVGPEKVRHFERVAVELDRLFKDAPRRFFQDDTRRVAEFHGLESDFVARILSRPNGTAGAMSRGDFVDSPSGLKCLEYNCGSYLGGWLMELVADLYLEMPLISGFLAERGLRVAHRNTMRQLFSHIARESIAADLCPDGELNVALVLCPSDPDSDYAKAVARFMPKLVTNFHPVEKVAAQLDAALQEHDEVERGELILCSYADFEVRQGVPYRGETRVHAIFELVEHPTPEIFECFKAGRVKLYTGPVSMMLSDKQNMALLSEFADSDLFDSRERELIERHVPWTRRIMPRQELYQGQRRFLPDLLTSERRQFVIKKGLAMAGTDVHVGRFTAADEWRRVIEQALAEGRWVAQEYVESLPYVYLQDDGGCGPHDVVWGLFVFGGRYAGGMLRMLPKERGGIVNIAQQATAGVLLEVED